MNIETAAAVLFAIALVHTFSTKFFERLAHKSSRHAGLFHLLGEVEVVFGFWAIVPVATMALLVGGSEAIAYAESRQYTEPAALTLAALMLTPLVFRPGIPEWLKYGALGVLFEIGRAHV